jgi:hypothetical protein
MGRKKVEIRLGGYCTKGHYLTAETVWRTKRGNIQCQACRKERDARHRQELAAIREYVKANGDLPIFAALPPAGSCSRFGTSTKKYEPRSNDPSKPGD